MRRKKTASKKRSGILSVAPNNNGKFGMRMERLIEFESIMSYSDRKQIIIVIHVLYESAYAYTHTINQT